VHYLCEITFIEGISVGVKRDVLLTACHPPLILCHGRHL